MALQQVSSRMIQDLAVTEAKIAAAAVTESKIGSNAVTNDKLSVALQNSISASNTIADKKLIMMQQVVNLASGTGSTKLVTTEVTGAAFTDTPGGSTSTIGVVTAAPNNKVQIRKSADGQPVENAPGGPDVFGRLTHDGTDYVLSFFYMVGAVETAYTFPADINIDILFPESFLIKDIPFAGMVNGVAFVDGLPASHTHSISEITELQESSIDAADIALYSDLITPAGASMIGFDGATHIGDGTADTVEKALISLDGRIDTLESNPVTGTPFSEDLTSQVGDGTPDLFIVGGGSYIAGSLHVYVRGVRQIKDVQYQETDPTLGQFEFINSSTPEAGDTVLVDGRRS